VVPGAVLLSGSALSASISLASVSTLSAALRVALEAAAPGATSAGAQVAVTSVSDGPTVLFGVAGAAAVGGSRRLATASWLVGFVVLLPSSSSQAAIASAVKALLAPGSAGAYTFGAQLVMELAASSDPTLRAVSSSAVQQAIAPSPGAPGGSSSSSGDSGIVGAAAGAGTLLLVGCAVFAAWRHKRRRAALEEFVKAHPHPPAETEAAAPPAVVIDGDVQAAHIQSPRSPSSPKRAGAGDAPSSPPRAGAGAASAASPQSSASASSLRGGRSGGGGGNNDGDTVTVIEDGGAGEDGPGPGAGLGYALRAGADHLAPLLPGQVDGLASAVVGGVAAALDAAAPALPMLGIALSLRSALLRQLGTMHDAGLEQAALRRRLARLQSLVERAGADAGFVTAHAAIFEGLVSTLRVVAKAVERMLSRGRLGRFVAARGDLGRLAAIDKALSLHVSELAAALQVETLHAVRSVHELGLDGPGAGLRSPLSANDLRAVGEAAAEAAAAAVAASAATSLRELAAAAPLPPFSMQCESGAAHAAHAAIAELRRTCAVCAAPQRVHGAVGRLPDRRPANMLAHTRASMSPTRIVRPPAPLTILPAHHVGPPPSHPTLPAPILPQSSCPTSSLTRRWPSSCPRRRAAPSASSSSASGARTTRPWRSS
jgi:hypothetical protein